MRVALVQSVVQAESTDAIYGDWGDFNKGNCEYGCRYLRQSLLPMCSTQLYSHSRPLGLDSYSPPVHRHHLKPNLRVQCAGENIPFPIANIFAISQILKIFEISKIAETFKNGV